MDGSTPPTLESATVTYRKSPQAAPGQHTSRPSRDSRRWSRIPESSSYEYTSLREAASGATPLTSSTQVTERQSTPASINAINRWTDLDNISSPLATMGIPIASGEIWPLYLLLDSLNNKEKEFLVNEARALLINKQCSMKNDVQPILSQHLNDLFLARALAPNIAEYLHVYSLNDLEQVTGYPLYSSAVRSTSTALMSDIWESNQIWETQIEYLTSVQEQLTSALRYTLSLIEQQITGLLNPQRPEDQQKIDLMKKQIEMLRSDTLLMMSALSNKEQQLKTAAEFDFRTMDSIKETTGPLIESAKSITCEQPSDASRSLRRTPLLDSRFSMLARTPLLPSDNVFQFPDPVTDSPIPQLTATNTVDSIYDSFCEELESLPKIHKPQSYIARLTRQLENLVSTSGIQEEDFTANYYQQLYHQDWPVIRSEFRVQYGLVSLPVRSEFHPAHTLLPWLYPDQHGVASVFRDEQEHACNLTLSKFTIDDSSEFNGLHSACCCAFGIREEDKRKQANISRAKEVLTAAVIRYLDINGIDTLHDGAQLKVPVMVLSLLTPDKIRNWFSPLTGVNYDERTMQKESFEALSIAADELKEGLTIERNGRKQCKVDFQLLTFSVGVNKIAVNVTGSFMRAKGKAKQVTKEGMDALFEPQKKGEQSIYEQQLEALPPAQQQQAIKLKNYVHYMYQNKAYKNTHTAKLMVEGLIALADTLKIVPYWFCKSSTDRSLETAIGVRRLLCDLYFGFDPIALYNNPHHYSDQCTKSLMVFGGGPKLQALNRGNFGFKTMTNKETLGPELVDTLSYKASMIP